MSQSGRILIVDDDVRGAEALAEYLQREGFEVQCAADGESGLEFLAAQNFDAVVLDWAMPGMDGLEVCRRIRARTDDRAHVGILMFSGQRVEDKDELAILDLGADDFMRKGCMSKEELLMRLRAVIRRRAAMSDAMATARSENE